MTFQSSRGFSLCVVLTAIAAASLGVGCTTRPNEAPPSAPGFSDFSGPYFGQEPPGSEPRILMPGLITTHGLEGCSTFLESGKVSVFSRADTGILFTHVADGRWTEPRLVPWSMNGRTMDFTTGADDRTLYFHSSRPTGPDDGHEESNAWAVQWTGSGSGWAEPYPLASPINSDEVREYYPSVASDGTTCLLAGGEICVSENRNGRQFEPELLEYPISTDYHEVDPVIAPDGSFIVFGSGRPGGYSFFDLYITFREDDGSWSRPLNGGKWFNTLGYSTRVNFTADGKYCIFQSGRSAGVARGENTGSIWVERYGESDVYWVSTRFIRDLRKENLHKEWAAEKIERKYRSNGLDAAVALLDRLSATERDIHYFSISELLMLCGRQVAAGKLDEADRLYESMLSSLSEPFRIRKGYAVANILNGQAEKGVALLRDLWKERPSERSATSLEPVYYQLFERERLADALTLLRFLTEEFPDSHTVHHELAEGLRKAGEIDQAVASCLRSLELKPDYQFAEDLLRELRQSGEGG